MLIILLTFQHVDLYPCSNGQPRKKTHEVQVLDMCMDWMFSWNQTGKLHALP